MYFYYAILQHYKQAYLQAKCILVFLAAAGPAWGLLLFVRAFSASLFQALLFVLGWVTWTFVEYILHRFWMHNKGRAHSRLVQTHHYHHTRPTEIAVRGWHRLLLFVGVGVIVPLAWSLQGYYMLPAGLVAGIAGFFFVHKLLHQPIAKRLFRRLLRYHIYHHCKYPNTCYGISVPWWDDLFGTVPRNPKVNDRVIAFYFGDHRQQPRSKATEEPSLPIPG